MALSSVGVTNLCAIKADLIGVEAFVALYTEKHMEFQLGTRGLNEKSKENLREISRQINIYVAGTNELITLYELAYMFATARHEAYQWKKLEYFSEFGELGSLGYFDKYDPVLVSSEKLRRTARAKENASQGDGYKYRGRGLTAISTKKQTRVPEAATLYRTKNRHQ